MSTRRGHDGCRGHRAGTPRCGRRTPARLGRGPAGSALLDKSVATTGAVIVGRRTYDQSLPYWGPDGPPGEVRLPVFVLTHRE